MDATLIQCYVTCGGAGVGGGVGGPHGGAVVRLDLGGGGEVVPGRGRQEARVLSQRNLGALRSVGSSPNGFKRKTSFSKKINIVKNIFS